MNRNVPLGIALVAIALAGASVPSLFTLIIISYEVGPGSCGSSAQVLSVVGLGVLGAAVAIYAAIAAGRYALGHSVESAASLRAIAVGVGIYLAWLAVGALDLAACAIGA